MGLVWRLVGVECVWRLNWNYATYRTYCADIVERAVLRSRSMQVWDRATIEGPIRLFPMREQER